MIVGIPAALFWYLLALTASAGALVVIFVRWYRHVARAAYVGQVWIDAAGDGDKAMSIAASYRSDMDRILKRGLGKLDAIDKLATGWFRGDRIEAARVLGYSEADIAELQLDRRP